MGAKFTKPKIMPEAEVALLFAFHLIAIKGCSLAEVALDGAQVMLKGREVFPLQMFLKNHGWRQVSAEGRRPWNGHYVNAKSEKLHVHARSGRGDVVAEIGGHRYYAECKKGPLQKKRGNPEYRLVREAIGQLMTISEVRQEDILVAVVPFSQKFVELTTAWIKLEAIKRAKIRFACVAEDGVVSWIA